MAIKRIVSSVAIFAIALAFVGLVASYAMSKSQEPELIAATPMGTITTSQGEMQHVAFELNTYPDSEVPENFNNDHSDHADWVSYGPSTRLEVPANSLVTITITNYDGGEVLNNTYFKDVVGVEGTATLNGEPFTSVPPDHVGHTFTLRPAPVNKDAELCKRGEPPQGATSQCDYFMRAECPYAGQRITDNHNPCPTCVQINQC